MLSRTEPTSHRLNGARIADLAARPERFAARADRAWPMPTRGPTRSMSALAFFATGRATRRSCKRGQGSREDPVGDAGDQGLSWQRGRQALCRLLRPIVLGEHADDDAHRRPTDAGRLRRASAWLRADRRPPTPARGCCVGTPTWPNHAPIIRAVGFEIVEYPYYERGQARIRFDDDDGRARAAPSRATSPCCTAAATIRPAPTSSATNGRR